MYATYNTWKEPYYADRVLVDDSYFKNNYNQQALTPDSPSHTQVVIWCQNLLKPTTAGCSTYGSLASPAEPTCSECDNYRYPVAVWWKFSLPGFTLPWRNDYENGLKSGWIDVWWTAPFFGKQGMIFVR